MNPQQADNLMVGREEVFEEQLFGGFYECRTWSQEYSDRSGGLKPSGYRLRFGDLRPPATGYGGRVGDDCRNGVRADSVRTDSLHVELPAPHTNYMEVTAVVPTGGRPAVDLMMAVWTPARTWCGSIRGMWRR